MSDRPREPGPEPPPHGAAEPATPEDVLSRLEERLDRASEAAERLLSDAAARAGRRPPPSGWQQPRPADGGEGHGALFGEGDLLLELLAALRGRIPPELQQRLGDALREVLLAVRALIDWYLERNDQRRSQPTEVEDIPIL